MRLVEDVRAGLPVQWINEQGSRKVCFTRPPL
jgi:hypothetical protein